MGKFKSYFPVVIALLISICITLLIGIKNTNINPDEIYKVYVDGNFIGAIKYKAALAK